MRNGVYFILLITFAEDQINRNETDDRYRSSSDPYGQGYRSNGGSSSGSTGTGYDDRRGGNDPRYNSGQGPSYPYGGNQNRGGGDYDESDRSRGNGGSEYSGGGYDDNYQGRYGNSGVPYGRHNPNLNKNQGAYDQGSENYPASYSAVPVPGSQPGKNCTGGGCCVPKCFAEKGSRVRNLKR